MYDTIDVHGTLAPKHLNWMQIPVTGTFEVRSPAPPTPKPIAMPASTCQTNPCLGVSLESNPPVTSAMSTQCTTVVSQAQAVALQPYVLALIFALHLLWFLLSVYLQ